jgi:hypothetical protein
MGRHRSTWSRYPARGDVREPRAFDEQRIGFARRRTSSSFRTLSWSTYHRGSELRTSHRDGANANFVEKRRWARSITRMNAASEEAACGTGRRHSGAADGLGLSGRVVLPRSGCT